MSRALLVVVLVGCGSSGEPTGFGINVHVNAQALSSLDRARITTASLTVSGDEAYHKTFDIRRGIQSGEVRFRYIPGVRTGVLILTLDAMTTDQTIVATGASGELSLAPGRAIQASIVLGAPVPDLATAPEDLSVALDLFGGIPPDMPKPLLNCLGIGNCVAQCIAAGMGDFSSCFQNVCRGQAKTGSASKWSNAFVCGHSYCDPQTDMMGKCVEVTIPPGQPNAGGTLLCDPGQTYAQCAAATTPGVCANCIANARNIILGDFSTNPPGPPTGICPNPASPDCKGGAMCMTLMNACIGDM